MAFQQPNDYPIIHRWTYLNCERLPVTEWTIQVRDAYNLGYVYTMVHDWIVEEGWADRDDSKFPETYYMHREPAFGKEIWLRWRLEKNPPGPGKSIFRYMMDVDWKIIGLKDTEIAWKGQKVKADKGEFEVTCRAHLLIDKEGEWKGWPFENIKQFYIRRQLRNKITMHKKNIYSDAYRFRDLIMNYLKLETFMPTKEAGEFFLKRTLE
ncbi:MAG: hypothetical protein QW165_04450 [Candidatus Woesearchaeota archaeon]